MLCRVRLRSGALAAVVLVCLAASIAAAADAAAASSRPQTSPIVRQLITVIASTPSATYVSLTAYRISGGHRIRVFGPWTARVGESGVAPPGAKREGDGRTPSGTFGFSFFFGVLPNPGFAFPFRHAFRYDYWDDDPASTLYNEWVDARRHEPGLRPEPMHQVPAYDYAAVITYNADRTAGLGSAIFLHASSGSATLGCVALPLPRLLKILRWLRPGEKPRITIAAR
jgi:L,D-peptidoglycan transpeptidase YkuD (ErfK/YbiS/YcfS/YnhG family)